ncbi:MAG: site-specific integrase [Bacteroidales bacterium]|nr:site-specific integrase [Bacteroidales bacterium]
MPQPKTCTKVSLLKRPYPSGRIALYLDFYPAVRNPHNGRLSRREYLGIYLYANPRNEMERRFNREMLEKGEAIRCNRFTELLNEQFGFLDHEKKRRDFLAYFKAQCKTHDQKWTRVFEHFRIYTKGACTYGEVTRELCNGFKEYLLKARYLSKNKKRITRNSASGYWSTFRGMLRLAYRDKIIEENINDFLDRIERDEVKKEYLTLDELKLMASSPCDVPRLKEASVFSCLTGLRISDVLALRWENIQQWPDGGYCMRIRTQKTQTEATLPLSDETLAWCGTPSTGLVFKGLKRNSVNYHLKRWLHSIGITKKISFHCFRHTFATLQLNAGTDIYTVSKLLTHRRVTTTQIYADVLPSTKRVAANRLTLK